MARIIRISKLERGAADNILAAQRNENKHGFMFIIPNHSRKVNEYDNKRAEALVNLYGCGMTTDMIQIWTHNDAEDNWSDHGYPYNLEFESGLREDLFPNVFPRDFFSGEQEGSLIVLDMEDDTGEHHYQTCCLRQQGYRYSSFGRFEEVLAKV